jgi:peptide methionine sulfoxide reductase MsrB
MIDKPNYKKDLAPEEYEVCWNKGTDPPFRASTMTAMTTASTSVSAVT